MQWNFHQLIATKMLLFEDPQNAQILKMLQKCVILSPIDSLTIAWNAEMGWVLEEAGTGWEAESKGDQAWASFASLTFQPQKFPQKLHSQSMVSTFIAFKLLCTSAMKFLSFGFKLK